VRVPFPARIVPAISRNLHMCAPARKWTEIDLILSSFIRDVC
jgi:hypothetical protein